MFDIRVGAPELTPAQVQDDAFAASQILEERRFLRLFEHYVDELVEKWARGRTVAERETAYYELEGFRGFGRYLAVVVDRGAIAPGGAANSQPTVK